MAPRHATCTRSGSRHTKPRRRYESTPDAGTLTSGAVTVRNTALAMVPPSPNELAVPCKLAPGAA
eukprot:7380587-Prymnesium_polylepis.1